LKEREHDKERKTARMREGEKELRWEGEKGRKQE
jgi:hypothetical protein